MQEKEENKENTCICCKLGAEKSGKLESSQAEMKHYLRETHSDSLREDSLGDCKRHTDVSSP